MKKSDPSKPVVRLAPPSGKESGKKKAVPVQSPTIKLAVRLNEGVNEGLRSLIRYRGDLSVMAIEALEAPGLKTVALVSLEENMVRDTTISLPRPLHKQIKDISDSRGTSMNILVNTALAYWLAKKGLITLR